MSAKTSGDNENVNIVKAAGQIGFYTLLSRVTGLVRDVAIGSVFGAGLLTDTFFTAFRIPNLLRRVVGEGASAAAFVPVVSEYRHQQSQAETVTMLGAVLGVGLVILLMLTAAGMVWAGPLTKVFAPGFAEEKLALTVIQLRIMFPYVVFIGLSAMAMGVLHAFRHFAASAFAPILLNIATILATCFVWWSPTIVEKPILALAGAVVVGGLAQLLWQVPVLHRLGVLVRPRWTPRHPAIRQIGFLLLPVLFSSVLYQLGLLVNSLFASLLAEGSVSVLWYANRVFDFPQGIFVVALSSAVLPSLTVQAQRGNLNSVSESLGFALRLVNFVVLPAAIGLILLARPICGVLFFHGAFSAAQVVTTATTLQYMAVGLWPVAIGRLLASCLYALHDTRSPLFTGAVAFVANVLFSVMLMGKVTVHADTHLLARSVGSLSETVATWHLGAAGLALASSLSATVNTVLLSGILYRRLGRFSWRSWFRSLRWSVMASLCMVWPVWLLAQQMAWVDHNEPFLLQVSVLFVAIVVGIGVFVIIAWKGAKAEFRALLDMLPERVFRLLPQFLKTSR
ncbi:MAG: murein biosynthesis integral membrane protein MurJ [Candidatus Binatia bacterium]